MRPDPTPSSDRELVLTRLIDAPRAKVYQAWTNPELLRQWFAPLPWTTPKAELDVRPGGANLVVMRGPDGNEFPNRGIYLEVVENERLVFTDAYTKAWEPSEKPFMTVILTFEDEGGKTRYTARVRHWTVADRETHEKMGFHQGWGQCADQLTALVTKARFIPPCPMSTPPKSEYLVISRGQWDKALAPEQIQVAIDQFYLWLEGMVRDGKMKTGQRLSTEGRTVAKNRAILDGPFGETKEAVGGYWFILADSLDEAAEIAKGNPCLQCGLFYEIRPIETIRASAFARTNETPD